MKNLPNELLSSKENKVAALVIKFPRDEIVIIGTAAKFVTRFLAILVEKTAVGIFRTMKNYNFMIPLNMNERRLSILGLSSHGRVLSALKKEKVDELKEKIKNMLQKINTKLEELKQMKKRCQENLEKKKAQEKTKPADEKSKDAEEEKCGADSEKQVAKEAEGKSVDETKGLQKEEKKKSSKDCKKEPPSPEPM